MSQFKHVKIIRCRKGTVKPNTPPLFPLTEKSQTHKMKETASIAVNSKQKHFLNLAPNGCKI